MKSENKRRLLILSVCVPLGLGLAQTSGRRALAQSSTPPPMASPTPIPIAGIPALFANYRPVSPDFWESLQKYIKDENWTQVVSRAADHQESFKKDSLDAAESQLFIAYGLYRLDFTFAATELFGEIVKTKVGTGVAERALAGLDEIAQSHPVDTDFVFGEILNDVEFGPLPMAQQDFVSYHNGLFNLQHGFERWGQADVKRIGGDSYWGFKLKYNAALRDVEENKNESALEKFKALVENTQAPESMRNDATHQLARLTFEKGDYAQAYKIFKTVKLNLRERGFILLERAWSRYYQKDYSRALGLLTAYEAPMFDGARTPESYILRMLMLKELCHYDAALDVTREFKERYKPSLAAIKKRKDLRKDPLLVNMAFMDQRYEPWVTYLNLLREEQAHFNSLGLDSYAFHAPLATAYKNKILETQARLSRLLEDKTREVANQLLDWQEQMTFLDYQTRLDSLRVIRKGDELQYKSAAIPGLTFDKIYWIFDDEFWIDELEDMKAFVESRCKDEEPAQ